MFGTSSPAALTWATSPEKSDLGGGEDEIARKKPLAIYKGRQDIWSLKAPGDFGGGPSLQTQGHGTPCGLTPPWAQGLGTCASLGWKC